jgi:hypothetical protein
MDQMMYVKVIIAPTSMGAVEYNAAIPIRLQCLERSVLEWTVVYAR